MPEHTVSGLGSRVSLPVLCRLGLVFLLVGVVLSLDGGTAAAQEDDDEIDVVLLGDSYSAGNGAGAYWGDDSCHRSTRNWAERYLSKLRVRGHEIPDLVNRACSGDTTVEVLNGEAGQRPPQIDAVDEFTDLVLLTIGGNDVNFSQIVRDCFASRVLDDVLTFPFENVHFLCRSRIEQAKRDADVSQGQLAGLIRNVLVSLKEDQDLRDDALVVLLSYPYLELGADYYNSYPVGQEVRALGDLGDAAQAAAVAAANAEGMNVLYLDTIKSVFSGHEPNGSPYSTNPDRWLHEFSDVLISPTFWRMWEAYHPNPDGQEAYAAS